jgi:hypothetical protein
VLNLRAKFDVRYPPETCPAGIAYTVECFTRSGSSTVPGLGKVDVSGAYSVESQSAGCTADRVKALPTTVRFVVRGKGEIEFRVAVSDCLDRVPPLPVRAQEAFTITGGSGAYAGATGSGTVATESYGPAGRALTRG